MNLARNESRAFLLWSLINEIFFLFKSLSYFLLCYHSFPWNFLLALWEWDKGDGRVLNFLTSIYCEVSPSFLGGLVVVVGMVCAIDK